jgi:hypothetical protein
MQVIENTNEIVKPSKTSIKEVKARRATCGRPSFFETKKGTIEVLKNWKDGKVNYLMQRQLIERGLIEKTGKTSTDKIEAVGRGRHKITYDFTAEGRKLFGQYGISRNWKS